MVATVMTGSTIGIEGYLIEVEVDITSSLPGIIIVGLPDAAVSEAKERVKSAIKNSGFAFPNKKIIINMAPADIKKEGSAFDLPLAIGVLAASEYISIDNSKNICLLGELSLDGSLRSVNGVLPVVLAAKEKGLTKVIVAEENGKEAALIEGIEIYAVKTLAEAIDALREDTPIKPVTLNKAKILKDQQKNISLPDFSEVKGQEHVKRALEIAATGGHNVLMAGAPGAGKSMLAKAFAAILPPLEYSEAIEVSKIYSVSGQLLHGKGLISSRPFRSPHHTASSIGIIGGGNIPKPGEISLAHRGVLFLDEAVEFPRNVLEVLRQTLEDKVVTISRAQLSVTYPADIILMLAMNPCPCGHKGDAIKNCVCSNSQVQKYWSKLSGPLLDRIDIQIEVTRLDEKEILGHTPTGENSETIRNRVINARKIQIERFKNHGIVSNSQMNSKLIKKYCQLDNDSEALLLTAIKQMQLSARAYDKTLRLARSIADLSGDTNIQINHIAEALQYRNINKFT
ncbi:MAG: YifB family Mg chelatase-like AAA ATPase [Vampirovibrionia bacterium]